MTVVHYYRVPGLSEGATSVKLDLIKEICSDAQELITESCFNVQLKEKLSGEDEKKLKWILGSPHNPETLKTSTFLDSNKGDVIEIGPRFVKVFLPSPPGFLNDPPAYDSFLSYDPFPSPPLPLQQLISPLLVETLLISCKC